MAKNGSDFVCNYPLITLPSLRHSSLFSDTRGAAERGALEPVEEGDTVETVYRGGGAGFWRPMLLFSLCVPSLLASHGKSRMPLKNL